MRFKMAAGWNKGVEKPFLCKFCGETDPQNFYTKLKLKSVCKKCHTRNGHQAKRDLKYKAIDHLGGKCIDCGYNKCASALEFHHLDPKEKDFAWGDSRTSNWEKLENELAKCVLLCANCHRERHDKEWFDALPENHPEKIRRIVTQEAEEGSLLNC